MDRDYTQYPAQTHLELLMQMASMNCYNQLEIEKCNEAYYLALQCVHNMMRGSGKPFITHLVGTASIMVSLGLKSSVVVASLMHAIYQRRVAFPNAKTIEERRKIVSESFGKEIEQLIFEYTIFEDEPLATFSVNQQSNPQFQDVLLMRLADELEDISYFALFMHGNQSDTIETRGSYLWRRENKKKHIQEMLELCIMHGGDKMIHPFKFWIDAEPSSRWSDQLKSGHYSSYNIG